MALNGNTLGTTITTTVLALNPDSGLLSGAESTLIETYWKAIATDIIAHYVASGVILPDTFNIGGVPVVGTGKIT